MHRKSRTWVGVLVFIIGVLGASIGHAQEAMVSGTVTDQSGGVIPGAMVIATHTATGTEFETTTDSLGRYLFSARAGTYDIAVQLSGFATVRRTNITALTGQRLDVDVSLVPAVTTEEVTVEADAPLVSTTKTSIGGNIDPRQVRDVPINGRSFLDLTILAPGSRMNSVGEVPSDASYQINIDGLQVTQNNNYSQGAPRYSLDSIAEFEYVAGRYDATQGRSSGVQINAVMKSGTNRYSGLLAGYFRDDSLNARDFITGRVLPYSNQQVSGTFGGPIRRNQTHFFANWERHREPMTYAYTSQWSSFNLDQTGDVTQDLLGGKVDHRFSNAMRMSVRSSKSAAVTPYDPRWAGGAARHPSSAISTRRDNWDVGVDLSQVISPRLVHRVIGGYANFSWRNKSIIEWPNSPLAGQGYSEGTPVIQLTGYTIGQGHTRTPQYIDQQRVQIRDEATMTMTKWGAHTVRFGGEFLYDRTLDFATLNGNGIYDARGGAVPANIEALFPVWNDPMTWNLDALNPIIRSYTLGVGDFTTIPRRPAFAGWLQDDWAISRRLTLNLGLRYDFAKNVFAQDVELAPFLEAGRPNEKTLFGPRLGLAYSVTPGTILRAGYGKYFGDVVKTEALSTSVWKQTITVVVPNDGRPDFASNPFGGPTPTYDQVVASGVRRSITGQLASPEARMPVSHQVSAGLQQQIGGSTVFEFDYIAYRNLRQGGSRNINLTFNPLTGLPNSTANPALVVYPDFRDVVTSMNDGQSRMHQAITTLRRRFSQDWQATATYSYTRESQFQPAPINPGCQYPMSAPGVCDVPIALVEEFAGGWYPTGEQAHRLVVNGIWDAPFGLQLSGLYFYGDNGRATVSSGIDYFLIGVATGRRRADGTLVERNGFNRPDLHRVDLRLQKRFQLSEVKLDGFIDAFNLFNHENYNSFTLNEQNASFGRPTASPGTAFQPRTLQLGFRLTF